jgi:hypothetical protein
MSERTNEEVIRASLPARIENGVATLAPLRDPDRTADDPQSVKPIEPG